MHVSYKLEIRKYYARTPEEKIIVEETKKAVKKQLREELSILVDTPKQGSGTTNTGNTARRAFEAANVFSRITGVNEDTIIRLRTILKAV